MNLASRLADVAEPGQILAAPEMAEELSPAMDLREQPAKKIKGVGDLRPLDLTRVR